MSVWLRLTDCYFILWWLLLSHLSLNGFTFKHPVTGMSTSNFSYIICLLQFRAMILTILFALMAIAALLQEEDVPFGQAESGGPDERV